MNHTYLALGDSYTIGEGVLQQDNFPHQAVGILNRLGFNFSVPDIIAKTGWTTDELSSAILNAHITNKFDFVSLLIGVNNQYRGRSESEYSIEFENLLKQAIFFAANQPQHVFVLSIPDWGATPFAKDKDIKKIAEEIDAFNAINKRLAAQYKVNYIDITMGTRQSASDPSFLSSDQLHPSAREYKRWAEQLATAIRSQLQ